MEFDDMVIEFLDKASQHGVEMVMVGGGAVNFHGYQRHSADVDFWINVTTENLEKLKSSLLDLGYDFNDFPEGVRQKEQNISIKISPLLEIELITNFNPGKSFEEVWKDSETATFKSETRTIKYQVINLQDLIKSKIRSARPKDLLDVQELKRIKDSN
ncbi:MAG: nucleotidyltransferase [Cyclobacteriaceae bacterium]